MKATTSTDTKEQILNVAEHLFAERGFAGTSLRSVIREAEVNLSAVHYHFGSKEELFSAVVARIAKPVVKDQLERLAKCQAQDDPPSVEAILEAFLTPPLQVVLNSGDRSTNCARFMGRCRTEPDPIRAIAEKEFGDSIKVYLDALGRSLPDFSRTELDWKLDLTVAVLVRVLIQARKPNALIRDNSPESIQTTVSKLVSFLAPGMRS
ncbi:TetR/AcrR family transcriptional regulator [Pleurocapsales cyanobacterium LEGE 06147]|nr:TetR/AcrR family transcriptional regulator [Pleurocapsales cyanobacterium LEGE 06147]